MLMPRNRFSFTISVGACLLCSVMILILPLQWIFAVVIAALIHEAFHALTVWMCGGKVLSVQVGRRGVRIKSTMLTPGKELICCLSGPAGSFLPLLLLRFIPRIAFCAAVHGVFNLLPLSFLDGGKAFSILLRMILPSKAEKLMAVIQHVCLAFLWMIALYLTFFLHIGFMPLIFMLAATSAAKKDLANIARNGYNSIDIDKGVQS